MPTSTDYKMFVEVDSLYKSVDYLEVEAVVQKNLMEQAEKAVQLSKRRKPMSPEHLESEKALLLACK